MVRRRRVGVLMRGMQVRVGVNHPRTMPVAVVVNSLLTPASPAAAVPSMVIASCVILTVISPVFGSVWVCSLTVSLISR